MERTDFLDILRVLSDHGVDFVVVGGTAAFLHGSSVVTYDVDVLMKFTEENCGKLLRALNGHHPRLSHTPDRRPLTLTAKDLSSYKNLSLLNDLGRLDVLGSLPPIENVDEVFSDAVPMDVGALVLRVISVPHLLRVKADMGRPKDKVVEAELRAIADVTKK